MSNFGLVKSFDIDHGELDGLRPQECFVLGYELAEIDQLLKLGQAIERPVHAMNRARIETSCRDAGRRCSITWMPGDASETWQWLKVAER